MAQNDFFAGDKNSISDEYDDKTLMPYGKYKGIPLLDVPDSYFIFLKEETVIKDKKLAKYIEENMDAFKSNVRR